MNLHSTQFHDLLITLFRNIKRNISDILSDKYTNTTTLKKSASSQNMKNNFVK